MSKFFASPYLAPHSVASGKGFERPTECLLLWLSFRTRGGSPWASPSPLKPALAEAVLVGELPRARPALPCTPFQCPHARQADAPRGKEAVECWLSPSVVSPPLGSALLGVFPQSLPDSHATDPVLRSF